MDNQQPEDDIEYQERPRPFQHKSNKTSKRWLIIGGIIAGVLLVGGGLFFILHKPAPAKQQTTHVSSEERTPVSTEPTLFKSTKLGMGVTYSHGWKLSESADKSEVILTSPKTAYKRVDGTSTQGVFTLKIRHGLVPDAMAATVQKAIAVKDSEVIGYTQPTADQRQYTNVTYAGADASSFSFLIVSGNASLKAGATIGYNIDLIGETYLIAGGYGADEDDALTFDPIPLAAMDSDIFQQAMDIVKSVQID